ncbi:hypothetical protein CQW23_35178 [Capsicum baccatum]|uniref:Uncharacterized protein n=1 Tax=Capsicum baccatum TaxID=33114 RepID=A0A2G2UWP6_CAPBA|nr:hypothetical protein CQW23_35178 [Capsicum baccatum]
MPHTELRKFSSCDAVVFRERPPDIGGWIGWGGTNRSDKGLNLSGTWKQGHSATYNTPSHIEVVYKGFCPPLDRNCTTRWPPRPFRCGGLANDTCPWGPRPLLRVGKRTAGACITSSLDSDLEAFSHNPAHGSFAPLAFQPSAMSNCVNQRKSRHRRIKKQRRYERLASASQLSRRSKGSLGHAFTMCRPSQTPHLTMSSARIGPQSEPWVQKEGQCPASDSRNNRIPLVRTSSELAVRRAGKAPEGTVPSPSPGRHAATRSRRGSSSSSPSTEDGFGTGTPVPSPQSLSFSQTYGSILPTSLAYIVPSTRGCSHWRPDAVMSTTGCGRHSVLRIFKGLRERTGRHATCGGLPAARPYLRMSRF